MKYCNFDKDYFINIYSPFSLYNTNLFKAMRAPHLGEPSNSYPYIVIFNLNLYAKYPLSFIQVQELIVNPRKLKIHDSNLLLRYK